MADLRAETALPVAGTDPRPSGFSPGSAILAAYELRKSYGPRPALRGLSFSLQAGRILGFLGPNGAGKTTSIRILTTILEPDAGHFVVNGVPSSDPDGIRQVIGVLPESLGFPKNMTGIEYLIFFGQLYGQTAPAARERGRALLEEVGLTPRARSLIGSYSRGMRQRLGIARALVNDPVVVFLDEPTLGLDPRGQQELLSLVQRIARERSAGVILCSHMLSEVESVCDEVVILSSGSVIASGPVEQVIGRVQDGAARSAVLRVQLPPELASKAEEVLAGLPEVVGLRPLDGKAGWLRIELQEPAGDGRKRKQHLNNRVLSALIRARIPVLGLELGGARLHEAFLNLTEEGID